MTTQVESAALAQLKDRFKQVSHLNSAQGLMHWDMEVYMPSKAAGTRGEQLGTLAAFTHNLSTAAEVGEWLAELSQPERLSQLSDFDQDLVRVVNKDYQKERKISADLVSRFAETTAKAHLVWLEARKNDDFSLFAPTLQTIIELNQEKAEALGYQGSPYNALLDIYEEDLTTEQLDPLFSTMGNALKGILDQLAPFDKPKPAFLSHHFPKEHQLAFGKLVTSAMGFDYEAGRQDLAPHPFCSGTSITDIRLTTRVDEHDVVSALFSSMHEAGHGLYEQGMAEELESTPLAGGTSLGIHESQSRMWENMIGRSHEFWQHFYPKLQAEFPTQLYDVSLDDFVKAVNWAQPSLIRVEADELTYNLHIMVRYEIEKQLINGQLAVKDLPDAWAAQYKTLLGIEPTNNTNGCLQDIHWSHGSFGYFPTYSLGNMAAAQFYHKAQQVIPDLTGKIAEGNLLPLREWLRTEIHQHGRRYTPNDLILKVCGEPLNSQYLVDYLKAKFLP